MPEDPSEVNNDSDTDAVESFIAAGNIPEMKTQLMMYKFIHQMNKNQGSPVVINAEQFRGTIKPGDKPKVTLYFLQKPEDIEPGFGQITADIGFRLYDKPSDPGLWSDEMYRTLAEKVHSRFASPIFSFKKGKEIVTYSDLLKGYQLMIWCFDKTEGHKVVEQVLDIQGHSPSLEFEAHKTNSSPTGKYPDKPDKRTIRGKEKRKRRVGAVGTVWFRYAFLTFPEFNEVIKLTDTTGSLPDPVLLQSPQILNYNVGQRKYTKSSP